MGKERQRTRINSKIDQLPEEIKQEVDEMLLNCNITYEEISEYLKSKNFDISRSAVGRYALRTNSAVQRLLEAQKQTEVLVSAIKNNPDVDYGDASMIMLANGLANKLAFIDPEEFDELPLDKAGRLITSVSRTKAYKDKVKQDMKRKVELAFEGMESEIMNIIKADAALAKELKAVLEKAREKMMQDD